MTHRTNAILQDTLTKILAENRSQCPRELLNTFVSEANDCLDRIEAEASPYTIIFVHNDRRILLGTSLSNVEDPESFECRLEIVEAVAIAAATKTIDRGSFDNPGDYEEAIRHRWANLEVESFVKKGETKRWSVPVRILNGEDFEAIVFAVDEQDAIFQATLTTVKELINSPLTASNCNTFIERAHDISLAQPFERPFSLQDILDESKKLISVINQSATIDEIKASEEFQNLRSIAERFNSATSIKSAPDQCECETPSQILESDNMADFSINPISRVNVAGADEADVDIVLPNI